MGNDGGDRRQPCGGLFGCGDGGGRGYMMEPDAVEAAVTPRVRDGLDLVHGLFGSYFNRSDERFDALQVKPCLSFGNHSHIGKAAWYC